MKDGTPLYGSVAPLRNVEALVELIRLVQDREPGLPGMACYYGPSGYGKTTAAVYAANAYGAYQVQVKSCWTRKKLCTAVLEDLGVQPAKTIADMVDQIAEGLARSGKPLLVDEADHLVARSMIEIVRDIHEASGSTVILIGEEQMPLKLQQWERVHGRMLKWVAAEPATFDDVAHLAPIYCPRVELDEALQLRLLEESSHSVRRISINLDRVKEYARARNLPRVTSADFAEQPFFTGAAPAPRRIGR